MEAKDAIGLTVFGVILLATAVYFFVINYRHRKAKKSNPSRHRGEYQPQKGRVYDSGVSYRSSGGEGYAGAGRNLVSADPAYKSLSGDPRDRAEANRKSRNFVLKAAADQPSSGE